MSFKGAHFPKDVIHFAVFFYVRYTVWYRDLKEILAERGVQVDHATLYRWVAKYSPQIAANARRWKAATDRSWRMDETYIKVKGEWFYLYRAVDKLGKTLDFMLSKRRNKTAATKFFARALEVNWLPCAGRGRVAELVEWRSGNGGPASAVALLPDRSGGGGRRRADPHRLGGAAAGGAGFRAGQGAGRGAGDLTGRGGPGGSWPLGRCGGGDGGAGGRERGDARGRAVPAVAGAGRAPGSHARAGGRRAGREAGRARVAPGGLALPAADAGGVLGADRERVARSAAGRLDHRRAARGAVGADDARPAGAMARSGRGRDGGFAGSHPRPADRGPWPRIRCWPPRRPKPRRVQAARPCSATSIC
jgi:hypothetical protein